MIKFVQAMFGSLSALLTGNFRLSGKTSAVVVGMERSARFGKCDGAGADADRMSRVLSNRGCKPITLLNNMATRTAVVTALSNAVSNSDLTVFFFSGHGGSEPKGDLTGETDGRNESICLYDGEVLDNEIWNVVNRGSGRTFMIFDCCHSETMYRCPEVHLDMVPVKRGGKTPNLLVWSGCPDAGFSYSYPTGGFLTTAICKTLKRFPNVATYNQIWNAVVRDSNLKKQSPRRTVLGHGFGGPVFR